MGTDPGELAFEFRAEQEAGTLGGARLHAAFRGIARPNAGPGAATRRPTALGVSTPEEARAVVDEIAATRADFVKIRVDDRGGSVEKLTPDLYEPVIEAAHRHGLQVIAHVYYLDDARALVAASVDGFAHLPRDLGMDDALVAAVVNGARRPAVHSPRRGADHHRQVQLTCSTYCGDRPACPYDRAPTFTAASSAGSATRKEVRVSHGVGGPRHRGRSGRFIVVT